MTTSKALGVGLLFAALLIGLFMIGMTLVLLSMPTVTPIDTTHLQQPCSVIFDKGCAG